jgi:hypothetical protein
MRDLGCLLLVPSESPATRQLLGSHSTKERESRASSGPACAVGMSSGQSPPPSAQASSKASAARGESHAGGFSGSRWAAAAAATPPGKSSSMVAPESAGGRAMHSSIERAWWRGHAQHNGGVLHVSLLKHGRPRTSKYPKGENPQSPPTPFFATPTKRGWETRNPLARQRRLPHRRWLRIISLLRSTMISRRGKRPSIETSRAAKSPQFSRYTRGGNTHPSPSFPHISTKKSDCVKQAHSDPSK